MQKTCLLITFFVHYAPKILLVSSETAIRQTFVFKYILPSRLDGITSK